MKRTCHLLLLLCFPLLAHSRNTEPVLEETVIRQRLQTLPCLIEPRYVSAVKGYLKTYLIEQRDKAEKILGRALMYFPLFEEELRKAGLPEELKYLAVVESALVPTALSRSGAGGLWQFMPQTGATYDLLITSWVDERFDPVKATRAAVRHLKKQYDRFGSWELALAAYNTGAGRLNRAIKRAHSKNFWRVRRYLPRETRNYVPAFIAATYLFHYYYLYGLEPQLPPLDLQLTTTRQLHEPLYVEEICRITGLEPTIVEALNPAWKRGIIAAHGHPAWLTLPRYAMPAVEDYLAMRRQEAELLAHTELPDHRAKGAMWQLHTYVVDAGESLATVAEKFQCHPLHIQLWNRIATLHPPAGTELQIWQPSRILRYKPGWWVEALPVAPPVVVPPPRTPLPREREAPSRYRWHRLRRHETLPEVARHYGIRLEQLYEWNPTITTSALVAGIRLRVGRRQPSAKADDR